MSEHKHERSDVSLPAGTGSVGRGVRIAWVGSFSLAQEIARRSWRPIFIDFFDPG